MATASAPRRNSTNPSSSAQLSLAMTSPSVRRCSCFASLGLSCCPRATLYGGSVSSRSALAAPPRFRHGRHKARDHVGVGGVAAHEDVTAHPPELAGAHAVLGVLVGLVLGDLDVVVHGHLIKIEAEVGHVELVGQRVQLSLKGVHVPAGHHRRLVVGEREGAPLRVPEVVDEHDRDLVQALLPRRLAAGVARHDHGAAFGVVPSEDRVDEPELRDALPHGVQLLVRVPLGVALVAVQLSERHAHDIQLRLLFPLAHHFPFRRRPAPVFTRCTDWRTLLLSASSAALRARSRSQHPLHR